MKAIDKHYVNTCGKESKMFIVHDNVIESMTLTQYNERYETNFQNWDDIEDDDLYTADEIFEYFGMEEVKFV